MAGVGKAVSSAQNFQNFQPRKKNGIGFSRFFNEKKPADSNFDLKQGRPDEFLKKIAQKVAQPISCQN
jgi:hypothetical protein